MDDETEVVSGTTISATPWERAVIAFVALLVLLVVVLFAAYHFRSQSFSHQENLQKACLQQGAVWVNNTCQLDFPQHA